MSSFRKIVSLAALIVLLALVWQVAVPYIKKQTGASVAKRIDIELSVYDPQPLEVGIGTTTLTLDFARTEEERQKGLSRRFSLGDDEGLLFVFDKPGYHSIWMKDMLFPIDIAWLDDNYKILHIEHDVDPSTYPNSFSPPMPARYVLEVNAGYFMTHGISSGMEFYLVDDVIVL